MTKKRLAEMLGIKPENIMSEDVLAFEGMVHGQMRLLRDDYDRKSDRRAVAQETVIDFMKMCILLRAVVKPYQKMEE